MLGIVLDTEDPAVNKTSKVHSFRYLLRTYNEQALL